MPGHQQQLKFGESVGAKGRTQASNPTAVTSASCVPEKGMYFPFQELIFTTYGKGLSGLTLESFNAKVL